MADIATVFHWTRRDMDDLTLAELADWRERARVRSPYGNE
ncbi:GpE family phage tail protein [Paraburkholderia graminis]|nr:GpE family phage tail protein [Paraburkholderia graminis]AXF09544.1 GpE family phage tail protein [Paraburkholderia graminis]